MSVYKYVNFNEPCNALHSKIESEIITLLVNYGLSDFQIPYDRPDLVLRNSANRTIRVRSCGYISVPEADGLNHLRVALYNANDFHIMFSALSIEDAVNTYDYLFRCIRDVKWLHENTEYSAKLRYVKSLGLDELVEWVNTNTPFSILSTKGDWEGILEKYDSSLDEMVRNIAKSTKTYSFNPDDKYVTLRIDGSLRSYGSTDEIWRDLGDMIERCLKDSLSGKTGGTE